METLFKINKIPHNMAQRSKFLAHYTEVNPGKIHQLHWGYSWIIAKYSKLCLGIYSSGMQSSVCTGPSVRRGWSIWGRMFCCFQRGNKLSWHTGEWRYWRGLSSKDLGPASSMADLLQGKLSLKYSFRGWPSGEEQSLFHFALALWRFTQYSLFRRTNW